jgi:hypothetical protein
MSGKVDDFNFELYFRSLLPMDRDLSAAVFALTWWPRRLAWPIASVNEDVETPVGLSSMHYRKGTRSSIEDLSELFQVALALWQTWAKIP